MELFVKSKSSKGQTYMTLPSREGGGYGASYGVGAAKFRNELV